MTLEYLHTDENKEDIRHKFNMMIIMGYLILHTKEYGNILGVHTNDNGDFGLDIDEIRDLYNKHNCSCLVTCFPSLHYKLHPDWAKEFNIMYPECDIIVYTDYRIQGLLEQGTEEPQRR